MRGNLLGSAFSRQASEGRHMHGSRVRARAISGLHRISRIGLHLPTRKIVPRAGRHGTIERYCARYMKYCCGAALVMAARLVIVPPVPAVTLFVVHTTGGIKLVVDNK